MSTRASNQHFNRVAIKATCQPVCRRCTSGAFLRDSERHGRSTVPRKLRAIASRSARFKKTQLHTVHSSRSRGAARSDRRAPGRSQDQMSTCTSPHSVPVVPGDNSGSRARASANTSGGPDDPELVHAEVERARLQTESYGCRVRALDSPPAVLADADDVGSLHFAHACSDPARWALPASPPTGSAANRRSGPD